MTLKEELEILRGEPIEVFDGDPMEIPCIETSDAEKLCKHPVVSVCMVTYNHEPYIRQAIEGVMMQKTDFEFELVIGEDCSQDKTREICFEYQKKYPDKIRVLWWHENVSRLGGNGRRVRARCRGEFIAFCEGDDYWIDPLKLQKQVTAMLEHPSVGYCVTGAYVLSELSATHPRLKWLSGSKKNEDGTYEFDMGKYKAGLIDRETFWKNRNTYPRTATVMYRKSDYEKLRERFEVVSWRLRVGDLIFWYGLPSICDAYYLQDKTAVYRLSSSGVCVAGSGINYRVQIDGAVERLYFLKIRKESLELMLPEYKQILCGRLQLDLENQKMTLFKCLALVRTWAKLSRVSSCYWIAYVSLQVFRRYKTSLQHFLAR